MSFITKNNILDAQHGFCEGKSTETATHAFLENIQKATEKKIKITGIFFFYLSKAYDVLTPWSRVLLEKLTSKLCS